MVTKHLSGTCSTEVSYNVDEEGRVHDVAFTGGCSGNLKAISRLVEGRPASEISAMLEGVTCGRKETSCSDQFAQVLKEDQ